jgi:hypothetical protein
MSEGHTVKPPFETYHTGCEVADREGHVCTADSPEIATALVAILNSPSPDLREALEALVKAWEVLRGPAHFPAYQIARWLQDDMTPAINNARSILAKHKE